MTDHEIELLKQKVLIHLYNSAVVGSVNVISMALGMSAMSPKNPRFGDLRMLLDEIGADKRECFYKGLVAIAEFAVYSCLDFIEKYRCFDAENNKDSYPHLSLSYLDKSPEGVTTIEISEFNKEKLGRMFKEVARSDEMRKLVHEVIILRASLPDRA